MLADKVADSRAWMSRDNINYFFFRIVLIALLTWTFACSLLSRRSATCISFTTPFRTSKFGIFWRTNLRSSTAKTFTQATSSRWLSKRSQSFRNSSSRSVSGVEKGFSEPGGLSTARPSIWWISTCSTTPATSPPAKHIPRCTARAGDGRYCTLSSVSTKTSRMPWFLSLFSGTSIFAVIPKALSRLVAHCVLFDDANWSHRSTLLEINNRSDRTKDSAPEERPHEAAVQRCWRRARADARQEGIHARRPRDLPTRLVPSVRPWTWPASRHSLGIPDYVPSQLPLRGRAGPTASLYADEVRINRIYWQWKC